MNLFNIQQQSLYILLLVHNFCFCNIFIFFVRTCISSSFKSAIDSAMEKLSQASHKFAEELYKEAQAQAQAQQQAGANTLLLTYHHHL